MPANIWPSEIEGFKPLFQQLFTEFDRVGAQLLSAIALYLDLGSGWFSDPIRDGNSILRLLHYPPVSPGRSEEHTSELQSLMRISYAVFCLKKKKHRQNRTVIIDKKSTTDPVETH